MKGQLVSTPHADSDEIQLLVQLMRRAGLTVAPGEEQQNFEDIFKQLCDLLILVVTSEQALKSVKRVRESLIVPLVVIVEKIPERLHVRLLAAGADLVLTRPYGNLLLVEQLRVLMRRATSVPLTTLATLEADGLFLDPNSRTVSVTPNPPQSLTNLEFRLLYTLMTHRGQTLTNEVLIERVWGYTGEGERDLIRNLISRLRTKIGDSPRNPTYIFTVPNIGYTFR